MTHRKMILFFALAFSLASCCSSKKPTQQLPAKNALPDRNINDSQIDSLNNKKVDAALLQMAQP